jgi:hypothetical protein
VNSRPEVKEKISAASKRLWADPQYIATIAEAKARPEAKAAASKRAREKFNDPEYRARMLVVQRARSSLTLEKAAEIRAALAGGETQTSIAKRYGISISAVSLIHLKKRWIA